jgi:predicted permease
LASIVTSVVPLFTVIFLGFIAGRRGMIDAAGVRVLVTFVFSFAMPAFIFRMMADTDMSAIEDWPIILAYFSAQLPIFLGGLLMGAWLFRQSMAEMTIQAFGSSFSNGVVLGLPLVLGLYGEQAGVPALLIITLDIVIFSLITVLMEVATLERAGEAAIRPIALLSKLGRAVLFNPLILAMVLGIGMAFSGISLPAPAESTLAFLGQAGPPAGLFALGATLGQRRGSGRAGPVAAMISMKLALHPLFALIVLIFADLDPVAAKVALLFAACPVGANVYVFAAHYRTAAETSAAAILLSTAISLFSLSALAFLLSDGVDSYL